METVALTVALFAIVYGAYNLSHSNKLKIFNCKM